MLDYFSYFLFTRTLCVHLGKNSKNRHQFSSVQSLSRVRLCDPMNCSTPGLPVHHQLPGYLFLKIYKRHIFKSGGTSRDLPLAVTPEGPVGGLRLLCPFRLARAFCTGPWASPCPRAWRPTRWRCCCWSCCTRRTTATTSTGR